MFLLEDRRAREVSDLHRKNLLWEGSRMFLPEHREQLQQTRQKSQRHPLPMVAADQLEEWNWLLQEAHYQEFPLAFHYLQDGEQQACCGFIEQVDQQAGTIVVVDGAHKVRISLAHVYRILPV